MDTKLNSVLPLSRTEKGRVEYNHYKKNGICPKCKRNRPAEGKVTCDECLNRAKEGKIAKKSDK